MQSGEIDRHARLMPREDKWSLNSDQRAASKPCPLATSRKPRLTNPLRELLDSKPTAVDGFLSYEYGLCAPAPLQQLQGQYGLWEQWAKRLPELYRTGKYQDFFRSQPILSTKELKDEDLLRANQILGLCAHAAVHFTDDEQEGATEPVMANPKMQCPFKPVQRNQRKVSSETTQCPFKPQSQTGTTNEVSAKYRRNESKLPASILEPWTAVNRRLGRPKPTFTYYDYFTLNVVPKDGDRTKCFGGVDRPFIYDNLKCDVQVFGDRSENVFVLLNHDMEFQSTPLISLACDAVDCMLEGDDEKLAEIIHSMGNVVTKVTQTFLHSEPNSYSELYCDPVSWSKTIGILIPPILDGEMSMSGLQSSFTHLVDVLIGRFEYDGELGVLAMDERPWLPKLHQELFRGLAQCSIRSYVLKSKNQALHGSFNRLVRLFVHGFLESHRLKICGFLELGMKTGRKESSGQTALAASGWQSRAWRKVNDDCLHSIAEREQLMINPHSNGFTGAFVEYITELAPGSESYRIVFDIAGTGMQYQAGDRVEILPKNRPELVTKMINVLGVSGGTEIAVDAVKWKNAVEQHYPDKAGNTLFPLASLLMIMTLRPLTKAMFDDLCKLAGIANNRDLERRFQEGMFDDVPDLLEFLLQDEWGERTDLVAKALCGALLPLTPRLYSVANSPSKDNMKSKVSIIISRIWYQVDCSSKWRDSRRSSSNSGADWMKSASSMNSGLTRRDSFHGIGTGGRKRDRSGSVWITGGVDERLGVCSSYLLNDSLYQYVPLRIVEEERFHLPDPNDNSSIVMIALGSGASPMFAFIEELLARGRDKCPEVFFCWGLASPSNLFGVPLLEQAIKSIGLKVCISFSREAKTVKIQDGKITIVPGRQERVTTTLSKDDWPTKVARLAQENGIFYLCGHPMINNTVRSVIEHALTTSGKLSRQESAQQYVRMVAAKRIRGDLYYSGSTQNLRMPSFSAATVARHNNLDDAWWIYKDDVYDVTDFMNLHPGGSKILLDKAGRDATTDFAIAHGDNNLRIVSLMLPYRIGKFYSPTYDSPDDQTAHEVCRDLLYTIAEIRNVFYMDVNMFAGGNESSGSPHSLAMRLKTHEKFESLSLSMLEAAATTCCNKIECLSTSIPLLSQLQVLPKIIRDFRQQLAALLTPSGDGMRLFVATELCQIEKDFLSAVVDITAEFLAQVERYAACNEEILEIYSFSSLQSLCTSTLAAMKQVLNSVCSMSITQMEARVFQTVLSQHEEFVSLAKCDFVGETIASLHLKKGDTVFRAGDIIDLIYVVLEGDVAAYDPQGNETDHFETAEAFGAIHHSAQIDVEKNQLGNEVMPSTTTVTSEYCKLAVLHPLQLLRQD